MSLALLDWRRSVAALHAAVRDEPDPREAHRLWCETRQRLFSTHPESPSHTASLRVAPYDEAWRFRAALEPAEPLRIELATATDGVVPFRRIGCVTLGPVGTLDVWWLDSYGGGVWLPLRDANPESYGGGRYVLDTVKGADLGGDGDTLVVDLNFAYNPSCAYDEAWACPLAPEGNRTDVVVPVGELLPSR
ncbi:MAG TPA: DUF1684 domain-containing protein [Mycobacteriales bacterium]|nr:DUF1684 domain-containing protein [Mycobacteriales bacterium]